MKGRVGLYASVVWVFVIFAPAWGGNLIRNPGINRTGTAPWEAWPWWFYGHAGCVDWANRKPEWGLYGAAFFSAGNSYGGFGQDIPVDPARGQIFEFAISARVEPNYTNENTYMGMEFWAGDTLLYAITQHVYHTLAARRDQWVYLTMTHTNTVPGLNKIKVRCDYSDGTIPAGTERATCQWDDARLWQRIQRPAREPVRGKFEPESGVYLGVLLERGGTAEEIAQFNQRAGKTHAVYAKFIIFKEDPFPWEWAGMIISNYPGAALHLILEPFVDFEDFFAPDWGPGQATYEAARTFVQNCAALEVPIFLRFAHEANGDWYPWHPAFAPRHGMATNVTPDQYIQAFRNFATLVRAHATNIAMVWAPNQGNGPDPLPYYGDVYPGDEYVDWVGLSVYNGGAYGNEDRVLDYQFRNAIQRGYWQHNDDYYDDTFEDFYWTFSDPNNPYGHQKPMMIAETAATFEPRYAISNEVVIAGFESLSGPRFAVARKLCEFQSLNSDGWDVTASLSLDEMESAAPWDKFGNPIEVVVVPGMSGNCLSVYTTNPVVNWTLGSIARGAPLTNWSAYNACEYWVRRAPSAAVDPVLQFTYVAFYSNYYVAARPSADRIVSSTEWMPVRVPFSEVSAPFFIIGDTPIPGEQFWTSLSPRTRDGILAVGQFISIKTSQTSTSVPAAVFIDRWSLVRLTNAAHADQDWWPLGPACTPWKDAQDPQGWITWQLVDDAAGGYAPKSLRITGRDANANYYIGGNGFTLRSEDRNWSGFESVFLVARRENAGQAAPMLQITLRDGTGARSARVADLVIAGTGYQRLRVPLSEFTADANFDWSNVVYVIVEVLSTQPGAEIAPLLLKELSLGEVVGVQEQDWWPAGDECAPWGWITWSLTNDAAVGENALRIKGYVSTSTQLYIGGNGCSLPVPQQNWSESDALALYVKQSRVPGDTVPKVKITLDRDHTADNGNEASVEFIVVNTNWYDMVIPFEHFRRTAGFSWTQIQVVKIELFTPNASWSPAPLYLDHMRRVNASVTNNEDNLKWKRDWINQVYALEDFESSDPNEPSYVSIRERFPNVHMINWFHVQKFEDGFVKDLRIVEDGGMNEPAFASYYQRIRSGYFLSAIGDSVPMVHYVNAAGTNPVYPYTSWETAATRIQDAIDAANSGAVILVSNGVYAVGGRAWPGSQLINRVMMDKPVTVRSVNGPDVTIIEGAGPVGSNAVRCAYVGPNSALVGFTLRGGATRSVGLAQDVNGGGVYCEGAGVISNCVVVSNTAAQYGGGVAGGNILNSRLRHNTAQVGGGAYTAFLRQCDVTDNTGVQFGGGVFYGTVLESTLSNNVAQSGAGAYGGVLTRCVLENNTASGSGGGAFSSQMTDCTLRGNRAGQGGGAIYGSIAGGLIASNAATFEGGGVYGVFASNVVVTANRAMRGGGAARSTLQDCVVENNVAESFGGGGYESTFERCRVQYNVSRYDGGGVHGGTAYHCSILSNTASNNGGGAYQTALHNCLIVGNAAGLGGGAYGITPVVVRLYHCTVASNTARQSGGGVRGAIVQNSIVYFNSAPTGANHEFAQFSFSCTTPHPGGSGNISGDPLFVSGAGGDYRLTANSPCVDTGQNADVTVTRDLDGNTRIHNGVVDMGAYEYGAAALGGYAQWASAIQNGATNPLDSAAGDGYPNLLKYATGGSPTEPDSMAHVDGVVEDGRYVFVFNRNVLATDVILEVQARNRLDADSWQRIALCVNGVWRGPAVVQEFGSGHVRVVKVYDPLPASDARYMRLKVTLP